MKIKEVQTHMSVSFGPRKAQERYFTNHPQAKIRGLKFKLEPGVGVHAWNDEDAVLIPFSNITAIKLETEPIEVESKSTTSRKKVS